MVFITTKTHRVISRRAFMMVHLKNTFEFLKDRRSIGKTSISYAVRKEVFMVFSCRVSVKNLMVQLNISRLTEMRTGF